MKLNISTDKKDEELLKFLVLFVLASTASVVTEAIFSYEL